MLLVNTKTFLILIVEGENMNKIKEMLKKIGLYNRLRWFKNRIRCELKRRLYDTDEKREKYIEREFKKYLGYEIDFSKQPETFNQKIQFRKLYDNNPLYAICSDKYRVREYVKSKVGEEYLIPLYLVTDKLTIEQWNKLPNSFVAKANHNSGPVQIVKDKTKVNAQEIIDELNNQLTIDYGIMSMEKYYSDIPRKIIVEKFLDGLSKVPDDYKFHCFNHKNSSSKIVLEHIVDRKSDDLGYYRSVYYNENWEKLPFTIESINYKEKYKKPKNFELMLKIVKKLAKDFDYARVDLYNIKGQIYVGEITFCDGSGLAKFEPEEWDGILGSYWEQRNLK